MSARPLPTLFIDRDGTLVEEPADEQVDRLDKVRLLPGVIGALQRLQGAGFRLVMVTNQDGLGTASFPTADFERVQQFIVHLFESQGVRFDAVFICPHRAQERCACRKPATGLVEAYLAAAPMRHELSAVIGDRDTDLTFAANLGVRGLRVRADGADGATWEAAVRALLVRRAHVRRATRETAIDVAVELDDSAAIRIDTGIGFFDHMLEQLAKHGGFGVTLSCRGDLTVDEHHTVEDCALALGQALREALGDKAGIGRYGFALPMDESEAQVLIDLSGRAHSAFEGTFPRERVGGLPTELVSHFFRSLADSLGAALHVQVRGENTHHMVEACFKCVGRALRPALAHSGAVLPSTKGVL